MKNKLLIIASLICFLSPSAFAAESNEPVVTIKPPPSYKVKKVLLFPLEIPSYAFKLITLPIGAGLKLMDEKGVMTKATNLLSNKERTFWVFPIIEGGAGTGFGGGIGIRHTDLFHRHYLLGASYTIHIDMSQSADVSFAKPEAFELFGKPVSYSVGTSFSRGLLNNYYGIGNNSSESNNALYASNDVEVGATLTYEPIDDILFSPYFGFSIGNSMSKGSGSSTPGVETIFPPAEIDGFGKWVNYADMGIRIANDTRDSVELTQRGGLRAFTFRNFYGMNRSGYNYNQYELDVRQFFPLWIPRQVLLLRCNFVGKIPTDGNEIPFWRLATLDVNSPLRGFPTGRFNDRAYILFNAEYRYPVWKAMDGVVFYDTGRVLHRPSDMSLSDIKYSVGGGLYFRIPSIAFFKFTAGYGGEGINMVFGAGKPL